MRLSDLQSKRIIDIVSGCSIGNVIDIIFSDDGRIQSFILNGNKGFFLFNKDNEEIIDWSQVTKIGEDVILVHKK